MGFKALEAAPGRNPTEVSVSVKRSSVGHPSRLRVCFHEGTAKALGWTIGRMVLPLIGDGPDQGMVKLQLTDRKGFRLTHPSRTLTRLNIVFPAPPGSPPYFRAEAVEFRISSMDRSMTIRLPWAVAAKRAAE